MVDSPEQNSDDLENLAQSFGLRVTTENPSWLNDNKGRVLLEYYDDKYGGGWVSWKSNGTTEEAMNYLRSISEKREKIRKLAEGKGYEITCGRSAEIERVTVISLSSPGVYRDVLEGNLDKVLEDLENPDKWEKAMRQERQKITDEIRRLLG